MVLGEFQQHVGQVAQLAARNTVFLYVDPFTLRAIHFAKMKAVYDQISNASASVELLLNLNAVDFMRWAVAAHRRIEGRNERADPMLPEGLEDEDSSAEPDELTAIAGGTYWHDIAACPELSFANKYEAFANEYRRLLSKSFRYVGTYPVKEKYVRSVPNYVLAFGTRHPDGIELMNDAMCKARESFLDSEFATARLMDVTPQCELPNFDELDSQLVTTVAARPRLSRKELRVAVLEKWFCRVKTSDVNRRVTQLLIDGRLFSSNGKSQINDTVKLACSPFATLTSRKSPPPRSE